jgi:CRISPR-associated protein Cmr1
MTALRRMSFNLETLTPLFLAGADARGVPELRAPSFRGVFRYWLRAAVGGVRGDDDLKGIQRAEESVFGSTQVGSPITLRLESDGVTVTPFKKQPPIRTGGPRAKPTGRDYLFWSMASTGSTERGNYLPPKQAIEKAHFKLILSERAGVQDANALVQSTMAVWLLAQLGGIGSRSRRTAGSLRVAKAEGDSFGLDFALPDTPSKASEAIGAGLRAIRKQMAEILNSQKATRISAPTQFDVLHPETCRIWILTGEKGWTTSEIAVEAIGAAMRDFRSYREPDHNAVRAFLDTGKQPPTVERAAFGLPLPFRYSDGGPADVLQGGTHERRSSPLSLRVSQLASGQFVGVAVLFESELLPRGEKLQFQRSKKRTDPPETYDLIRQFIAEKFNALEVKFQ